jgi:hypothetical protein
MKHYIMSGRVGEFVEVMTNGFVTSVELSDDAAKRPSVAVSPFVPNPCEDIPIAPPARNRQPEEHDETEEETILQPILQPVFVGGTNGRWFEPSNAKERKQQKKRFRRMMRKRKAESQAAIFMEISDDSSEESLGQGFLDFGYESAECDRCGDDIVYQDEEIRFRHGACYTDLSNIQLATHHEVCNMRPDKRDAIGPLCFTCLDTAPLWYWHCRFCSLLCSEDHHYSCSRCNTILERTTIGTGCCSWERKSHYHSRCLARAIRNQCIIAPDLERVIATFDDSDRLLAQGVEPNPGPPYSLSALRNIGSVSGTVPIPALPYPDGLPGRPASGYIGINRSGGGFGGPLGGCVALIEIFDDTGATILAVPYVDGPNNAPTDNFPTPHTSIANHNRFNFGACPSAFSGQVTFLIAPASSCSYTVSINFQSVDDTAAGDNVVLTIVDTGGQGIPYTTYMPCSLVGKTCEVMWGALTVTGGPGSYSQGAIELELPGQTNTNYSLAHHHFKTRQDYTTRTTNCLIAPMPNRIVYSLQAFYGEPSIANTIGAYINIMPGPNVPPATVNGELGPTNRSGGRTNRHDYFDARDGSGAETLLAEGIESNPGPNVDVILSQLANGRSVQYVEFTEAYFTAHVDKLCEMVKWMDIGYSLAEYTKTCKNANVSFFSLLADEDFRADKELDELDSDGAEGWASTGIKPQRGQNARKPRKGEDDDIRDSVDGKAKPQPQAKAPPPTKKSPSELAEQRTNVLRRIASRMNDNQLKLVQWTRRKPAKMWFKDVTHILWGVSWQEQSSWTIVQWHAWCYLNSIPIKEAAVPLFLTDQQVRQWHTSESPEWNTYFKKLTGDTWFDAVKVYEADCRLNNKLVHAYNGNPVFSDTMEDVDASPKGMSLYSTPSGATCKFTGAAFEHLFGILPSRSGPISTTLATADQVLADISDEASIVAHNQAVRFPISDLTPRRVRSPLARQNAAVQLSQAAIHVSDYYGDLLELTPYGQTLVANIQSNMSSAWRRDNIISEGFSVFDLTMIMSAVSEKGLSMEQIIIKILLLHSCLSHNNHPRWIPNCAYEAVDTRTIAQFDDEADVIVNDFPVFNEDCGGDDPVFPFGGEKGTLAFHLSMQSIPEDRRETAIFMAPRALQSAKDGPAAIALEVMCHAPWPFVMYGVEKRTSDINGGRIGTVPYVCNASTVYVPGSTIIDVIMPRSASQPDPQTMAQANALVTINPTFGSQATQLHAADEVIDMSWGNPDNVVEVELADYLYSWSQDITTTHIKMYLTRMAVGIGMSNVLSAIQHDVAELVCNTGYLLEAAPGQAPRPAFNTILQLDQVTPSCHILRKPNRNWPRPIPSAYDKIIAMTDILAYNKVNLAILKGANTAPESGTAIPEFIANPRAVYWMYLDGLTQAAVFNTYYSDTALDTQSWNTSYTQSVMSSYQEFANDNYAKVGGRGALFPPRQAMLLSNLYTNMLGVAPNSLKPMTAMQGKLEINFFSRTLFPDAYATVFTPAGNERPRMPPMNLPDVFIHMLVSKCSLALMSYPPAGGKQSTMGYNTGMQILQNNQVARYSTFLLPDSQRPNLANDEMPDLTDEERWNLRLWWNNPNRVISDYAAQPLVAANYLQAGTFAKVKFLPPYPNTAYPAGILAANTITVPFAMLDGTFVFPFIDTALVAALVRSCQRIQQLSFPSWLINSVVAKPVIPNSGVKRQTKWEKAMGQNFGAEAEATVAVTVATGNMPVETASQNTATTAVPTETPQPSVPSGDTTTTL